MDKKFRSQEPNKNAVHRLVTNTAEGRGKKSLPGLKSLMIDYKDNRYYISTKKNYD